MCESEKEAQVSGCIKAVWGSGGGNRGHMLLGDDIAELGRDGLVQNSEVCVGASSSVSAV